MKTLKDAAPGELAALRRRAIRTYAMGYINESECSAVTTKIDELIQLVDDIEEGDNL